MSQAGSSASPSLSHLLGLWGVWFGTCLWLSKKSPHKQEKSQGKKLVTYTWCYLGINMPVNVAWFTWSLQPSLSQENSLAASPFSSEHQEKNYVYNFPWFTMLPNQPQLILKEKANYRELSIKIFTCICTAKWTCDLAFSRLNLKY